MHLLSVKNMVAWPSANLALKNANVFSGKLHIYKYTHFYFPHCRQLLCNWFYDALFWYCLSWSSKWAKAILYGDVEALQSTGWSEKIIKCRRERLYSSARKTNLESPADNKSRMRLCTQTAYCINTNGWRSMFINCKYGFINVCFSTDKSSSRL